MKFMGDVREIIELLQPYIGRKAKATVFLDLNGKSSGLQVEKDTFQLLNPKQVAEMLGYGDHACPLDAVRHLRRTGRLRGIKIGRHYRYKLADVMRLVDKSSR